MIDAQIKHEKTLVDSLKENPKRFYNHVRNFVKTDASVDHLITSDENQISDHFEIAEEFNRFFFSSVMTKCIHYRATYQSYVQNLRALYMK